MKKKFIILLLNLVVAIPISGVAQCWFSQLAKDVGSGSEEFKSFIKNGENSFDIYKAIVNAQGVASPLRNDIAVLNKIAELKKDTKFLETIGGESGFNNLLRDADRAKILKSGRRLIKGLTDAHYDKIEEIMGVRAKALLNEIEDNPAFKIGTIEEMEALAKSKKWRLKPDDTYTLNGYTYKTDKYGRIETVEGDLKLDGVERHPDGPLVGEGDGKLPNDVGGHLIGRQFGGAGDASNVVAMDKTVNAYSNTGKFGQHEIRWRSLLKKDPPAKISLKIEEIFNPGNYSIRPDAFDVTEVIDGVERNIVIPNN